MENQQFRLQMDQDPQARYQELAAMGPQEVDFILPSADGEEAYGQFLSGAYETFVQEGGRNE